MNDEQMTDWLHDIAAVTCMWCAIVFLAGLLTLVAG